MEEVVKFGEEIYMSKSKEGFRELGESLTKKLKDMTYEEILEEWEEHRVDEEERGI